TINIYTLSLHDALPIYPQVIYVNIINTDTGCDIATVSFNIAVHEAAQANPDLVPIVYEICDDEMDFDGDTTNNSAQFDLATQNRSEEHTSELQSRENLV